MGEARFVVGVDLGTTHTVVAFADLAKDSDAQVFPVAQLVTATEVHEDPLLPSVLYAPIAGETATDRWGDAPWIVGKYAQRRGADVPGRLVASAKSWLCHAAVDRTAPILPWGAEPDADDARVDVPKISPIAASARILGHVRRAWDERHPDAPLAEQEVVLTVPASFDEAARELTALAAETAGLRVRLLEEPQAAFYDYLHHAGQGELEALAAQGGGVVLVCDVGGGTTDLSLIRVAKGETEPLVVTRVAVGRHLLLGGDNMDLALAHTCETKMGDPPLSPARFAQLVLACRGAKERLLGADPPADVGVSVAEAGARLVGGTRSARLVLQEAEAIVLDGFFPAAPRDAAPERARSGLVGFGLPYERDVAITRHVAAFFARHAEAELAPRALLLNGGVFKAARIAERLALAIDGWGGPPVTMLPHADPDLAVARGAVAYALARRGRGLRIGGGSARGYYVEVDAAAGGAARRGVCVVPRGAQEGVPQVAAGRPLQLLVGRPTRFELYASDVARADAPGDVVVLDDAAFDRLPPVAASFAAGAAVETVPVILEGELSAIGTLDLACVESPAAGPAPRRFRLAFALRGEAPRAPSLAPQPSHSRPPPLRALDDARALVERIFGKGKGDVAAREVKDVTRDLERMLGERRTWTAPVARAVFDALWAAHSGRRRSAEHERIFWQLAGYCLRPGFGDPLDASRVAGFAKLLDGRLAFPDQARAWQAFWIAWRRVAAGLDEPAQAALRDLVDPVLAPPEARRKKPKSFKPDGAYEMLEMASSLERVPADRRAELGGWLLERTWTDRDPRLWAAIGRLGARTPAYASVHHVVAPSSVERWVDHLLREKWELVPTAAEAAARMARLTEDRARDLPERVRRDVARRLSLLPESIAHPAWVRAVLEPVDADERDRVAFFGEEMPVGLKLA